MPKIKIPFFSIAWFIVVLCLSFISFKSFESNISIKVEEADKLVHFLMYFILTLLLLLELGLKKYNSLKYWLRLATLAIFLSGVIELLQHFFTNHRSGDWFDFYANSFGSFAALLVFVSVKKLFNFKNKVLY